MTNPDYTHLALVVDRSGSMFTIASDMNGAIAKLLEDQAAEPGTLLVDAWTFDEQIEHVIHGESAATAASRGNLVNPRGGTALLDAVGLAVTELGAELAKLDEDARPGQVVLAIVTDGHENSSRDWSAKAIRELLQHQQQVYSWTVLFIGANIDAASVGDALGVPRAQTIDFGASAVGTQSVVSSTSSYLRSVRTTGAGAYSDEDRAAAAR